jgi:hypothetical protein
VTNGKICGRKREQEEKEMENTADGTFGKLTWDLVLYLS